MEFGLKETAKRMSVCLCVYCSTAQSVQETVAGSIQTARRDLIRLRRPSELCITVLSSVVSIFHQN